MLTTHDDIIDARRRLLDALGDEGHALISTDRAAAERAVAGELAFEHLGVRYYQVGRAQIDWSGPQQVHQEWQAQLNRFFHIPSLAAAYLATGEERFAEAARDFIADWMRAHPARENWETAPYDNTLNLSIRVIEWVMTLADFLPSPAFSDEFVGEMLDSIRAQLDFLGGHLAPAANWRIAHADSLLMASIALPMLPEAEGWRDLAVRVLNDAFQRQVLPDGAHCERTPGYHHWMTNVFERYWQLARALPELGLCMRVEPIARMHDYALATTTPNGSTTGLHDCDARFTGAYDPTVADARAAFRRKAGLPEALPPASQFFPDAGQAFFRDRWDEDAVYVTFDATTWGGAHCHLSRNAVQVHAYGRGLLVDPGTLTYEVSDPKMASGKATRAHNTLNLNGWNQSDADPTGTRCVSLPGYDLACSRYEGGYWPGTYHWGFYGGHGPGLYGAHFRTLLWIHDRCVVVLDHFAWANDPEPPVLESNWQLTDGPYAMDAGARRVVTQHPDANLLLLFPIVMPGMTLSVHEGEHDPERGWLPGDGGYTAAPQITLAAPMAASACAQLATVLIPFRGAQPPALTIETGEYRDNAPLSLRLRWADGHTDEIIATPRLATAIDAHEEIVTDAALVHLHKDADGKLVRGLVVDGTYLRPYAAETQGETGTYVIGG